MGVAVVEGKKPWGFNIFDNNRKSSFYQTWKKFRGEKYYWKSGKNLGFSCYLKNAGLRVKHLRGSPFLLTFREVTTLELEKCLCTCSCLGFSELDVQRAIALIILYLMAEVISTEFRK